MSPMLLPLLGKGRKSHFYVMLRSLFYTAGFMKHKDAAGYWQQLDCVIECIEALHNTEKTEGLLLFSYTG